MIMYIPFVDDLVKTPIAPGASILVEYDPTAAWYQVSLNIAAGWLKGGGIVVYAVALQPPDDVRSQLAKLGLDVRKLESDDKLRLFDWYTATLGRKSTEKYAYYSLKAADLSVLYSKNMPGSGLTLDVQGLTATDAISRNVMGTASSETLRILDDLSCLSRFNEEKSWVELLRTRLIPLGRLLKSTGIGGIIKGIHSDWVYKNLEAAVDGVIDVKLDEASEEAISLIRVRWMRNANFDSRWHRLRINDKLEVVLEK